MWDTISKRESKYFLENEITLSDGIQSQHHPTLSLNILLEIHITDINIYNI